VADINKENIKAFIQGNLRMMLEDFGKHYNTKFFRLSPHIREQVLYRKHKCPDCLAEGHCSACSCSVPGKWFANDPCKGERYPKLMGEKEWENFKTNNNIVIDVSEDIRLMD